MEKGIRWVIGVCFLLAGVRPVMFCAKSWHDPEALRSLLPQRVYDVEWTMELKNGLTGEFFRTYLPRNTNRQTVIEEGVVRGWGFNALDLDEHGRAARWEVPSPDAGAVVYRMRLKTLGLVYDLDSLKVHAQRIGPTGMRHREPTPEIQSNHPEISALADDLADRSWDLVRQVDAFYGFVLSMPGAPFKGLTDALTALRLGEASCNGKSRLLVALCRNRGIPARLVGGLILESGVKQTSHQWCEVLLGGMWVPFDPLNGHRASLPAAYLELYQGDAFLFGHTPERPLEYAFRISPRLAVSSDRLAAHRLWMAFDQAGIPVGLLGFLLMLPLGAALVAVLRTVVGLRTFGLFLPALIAVSLRETGLWVGLLAFVLVLSSVALLHPLLERWRLMYTPRLAIMLIAVVGMFLGISASGIVLGKPDLAFVTLFPVVVVAITAERLAREIEENGWAKGWAMTASTLLVVVLAYVAMESVTLESLFLAFPELFLALVGAMIWLGRWTGIRALEFHRFRHLLRTP